MLMNEKEQTLIVVKYFDFSFLWLDFAQNRYSYHLPDIHPSNMYSISQPENVQGYIMTKKMQSYTFCDSDFIHTHSTGALSTASFCYTFLVHHISMENADFPFYYSIPWAHKI